MMDDRTTALPEPTCNCAASGRNDGTFCCCSKQELELVRRANVLRAALSQAQTAVRALLGNREVCPDTKKGWDPCGTCSVCLGLAVLRVTP